MKIKKIISLLLAIVVILANAVPALAAEKQTVITYRASATQENDTYKDNAPINRVFRVKTGSKTKTRKLNFKQIAGSIEYYMCRVSTKSCMQKYDIVVFNETTNKGKSYEWNWSKTKTITLEKNSTYTVIIRPSSFAEVYAKYLSSSILKLNPIIYGYKTSPYYTITTSANIKYDDEASLKIAYV